MTRWIALLIGIFVAGGAARAVDLLPGGFFAPGNFGQHEVGEDRTLLRTTHDFLLYATQPGPVTVTLTCTQVGRYNHNATATVTSPAGETLTEGSAAVGESSTISFEAAQVGPYTLRAGAGRNAFTLDATGARLLIPAGADGQPFEGISHAAPVYLFVPPGAERFTVNLGGQGSGETASARVLGPDGSEIAALSTGRTMTASATIDVPVGSDDNVWALVVGPAETGIFEDFNVTLSGDVSPYVAQRPEDLLCPAINAASMRVSRERRDPVLPVSITAYLDLPELGEAEVAVEARPFEGGAPVWSQRLTELPARRCELAPEDRLPTGKYRWSLTLSVAGETMKRFDGTWWYVPAPNYVTDDLTTLVNGEPFFARGLYHVNPEDYELVRDAGFNAVQCRFDNVPAAQAAGLRTGVALYWTGRPNSERWRAAMDTVLDNDSVFGWWMQDEPANESATIEALADGYLYVRTRDPNRPAYTCINNPNAYEQLAPQTDIVAPDVYPIGRGPLTTISDTLDHARRVIPNHVLWFIGQVWPWPNSPLVTPEQHRCMTYLALAHGARGLFWYSFRDPNWYLPENNPELWEAVKAVNAELIALEPALLTPNVGQSVIPVGDSAVHACARRVGDEVTVIAVNPGDEAVSARIPLAELVPGVTCAPEVEVRFEERHLRLSEGAIVDNFAPLEVHVYRLTGR